MQHPFRVDFIHRVAFTRGLFQPANSVLTDLLGDGGRPMVALVDDGVAAAFPDLERTLRTKLTSRRGLPPLAEYRVVRGGEACKQSREVPDLVVEFANRHRLCRQSWVLAIGGGALLDAVGYGAAVAHRGVRLVRVPTTVLAQDDAGMGVKNAINRFGKKNFEGVFAVPWAVLNDADFLPALPDRDWRGGFSEAVKIALLKDPALLGALERNGDAIRNRSLDAALPIIERSGRLHLAHIVEGGDPFEMSTARPLDYGHWAAHKLEALTGYELHHGEAVAIGVALDSIYSNALGWLPRPSLDRILSCLRRLGLSISHPRLADPELLKGIEEFREHLGGRLSVTMLREIGRPEEVSEIDPKRMAASISTLQSFDQDATIGTLPSRSTP